MSSSPALAPRKAVQAQPFPYADASTNTASQPAEGPPGGAATLNARHQQEIQKAQQEGEARARQAFEQEMERVRNNLRTTLVNFEKERKAYFQRVESEVVKLALSIARKVLHREAQVDPLLLAGVVRVALEQIENKTKVIVRVNPLYAADCRGFFARGMEPHEMPEIEEDPAIPPEQCLLETELGSTELGIEVQLKEIEQGLMDLLAQRPQMEPS